MSAPLTAQPASGLVGSAAAIPARGAVARVERLADNVTLYQGDALALIPTLGTFDVVATDPPYGVRAEAWDAMGEQEFARFSMAWMAAARLAAPELLCFCTEASAIRHLAEMIYPRVRPLMWTKPPGSQYPGARERTRWFAFEVIVHGYTPETWSVVEARDAEVGTLIRRAREAAGISRGGLEITLRGRKTGLCFRWEEGACLPTPEQADGLRRALCLDAEFDGALQRAITLRDQTVTAARAKASEAAAGRTDVLSYRTVTAGTHPCEKPIGLMEELLTEGGGTYRSVLDPFAGSGSTGVAAVRHGIAFTGIESDAKHFDTACRRIADELRRPRLFAEPAPAAKQGAFL